MQNRNVLAVWGSPWSGKTLISTKLASLISQTKKDVILLYCDQITPSIPVIAPQLYTVEKSLGRILSAPELTQEIILANCLINKKNSYLAFLGYQKGENALTYPDYTKRKAVDLIIQLRHLADYIIIDCASNFTSDALSMVSMEMADSVLQVCSCNLKDLSFFSSYMPMMSDKRYKPEKNIKVLSNFKSSQPKEEFKQIYQEINFELPYIQEVDDQFTNTTVLEKLTTKEGKNFEDTLRLITREVFDGYN